MTDNPGLTIPGEAGGQQPDLNSLARYYHGKLSGEHRAYLNQRGLTDESIEKYQIGYDDGVRFGFIGNDGALGDYFQDRYIFPITDAAGQVVNMVGRAVDNTQPVYKNLPAQAVQDANALFNEGLIGPSESVFLCEGIIDAITLTQAGYPAVAILGPGSFRPEWAEKFKGKHLFICFDNDEIGRKGRDAVAQATSAAAAEVYLLNLPEGVKDVNDFFLRVKDAAQTFGMLVYQAAEWGKFRQFPADSRNLNAFMQEVTRRHAGQMVGVPTGFAGLDQLLFGGLLAGLYLITGKAGAGKTVFLKNIADHLAESRIPVIFVSLEKSAFELWALSMSRLAGVPAEAIIGGRADPAALQAANQTYSPLASLMWTVEGAGPITAGAVESFLYQTINELGTAPVVCVDSLQRLAVDNPAALASPEMADSFNMQVLKQLAQKYACPILVASAAVTPGRIPGGSAAAAAADVALHLAPGEATGDGAKRPVELQVVKSRNGVPGVVRLSYDAERSRYQMSE